MRTCLSVGVLTVSLGLLVSPAWAGPGPSGVVQVAQVEEQLGFPQVTAPPSVTAPLTEVFSTVPGIGPAPGVNPVVPMMGDFFGFCALRSLTVPSVQTCTTTTTTIVTRIPGEGTTTVTSSTTVSTDTERVLQRILVCDPLALRGIYKISNNESPVPQDRVFFTYTYGRELRGSGGSGPASSSSSVSSSTTTIFEGNFFRVITDRTAVTDCVTPGTLIAGRRLNAHVETLGFEKTLFDGNASIGVRLPAFQQEGDGSFGQNDFGDLSVILKYVLFRADGSGNLISTGVMVTAPTGPAIPTTLGDVHATLVQPYVGHIWFFGDLYLQGFSSVSVPTDSRDVTLAYNSLGLNYLVYRSSGPAVISSLTPSFEVHVTTPLDHRGNNEVLVVPDLVSLSGGVHFGLGERALLTLGVNTPVTGPRPYEFTANAYLNFRF